MEFIYFAEARLAIASDRRSFAWMRQSVIVEDLRSIVAQFVKTPKPEVEVAVELILQRMVTNFSH